MADEKKLSRKERKELEAQRERENKEWEAKYQAKVHKKNITKLVTDIEKAEKEIIANAAQAKMKGYNDVYGIQLKALKTARARKAQAEKFLFQIDTMEKMKSLADSSTALLGSMSSIMGSLGALSLDKEAMMQNQKDFMAAQTNLSKQSQSIEQFFGQMEMMLPDENDEMMDDVTYGNEALDDEIKNYIISNSGITGSANMASSGNQQQDAELENLRSLLANG